MLIVWCDYFFRSSESFLYSPSTKKLPASPLISKSSYHSTRHGSVHSHDAKSHLLLHMSSSTASDKQSQSSQSSSAAPKKWMKCVNGVAPGTCSLNFAVSNLANVTLEEANELIKIGAVWARFDYLEEYEQSLNEWGMSQAPSIFHDDMQERQGEGNEEDEEDDLEEYIARLEYDSTYQRIMEPTQIQGGTDLRIYPYPRRFPACYEFAKNKSRLLYQDTTFVVVDKPPMLPTQPDASNYLECCPGCANDWLGPFYDIDNELVERPLLCHRVDSCVGGCVVLSKDKNGQKVFSELQVSCVYNSSSFVSLFLVQVTNINTLNTSNSSFQSANES